MAVGQWRIIAQRILTGEFLEWDVPLGDATRSWELSGPGGVFGKVEPDVLDVIADDGRPLIEEWSTALYVEDAGQIRAGGIVQKVSNEKAAKRVEAPGFSSYPNGIPCVDNYTPNNFEDPIVIFRHLWDMVQGYPDGNLGVEVLGPQSFRRLSDGAGPYKLVGTDMRDYGDELNRIAAATPFDYVERHNWSDDTHKTINHVVRCGFPRVGARRTNLSFVDSENIIDYSAIGANGERYANDVYVIGPGEGLAALRARAAVRDGRLRRVAVVPLKDGSQGELNRRAQAELRARGLLPDLTDITIMDSANARLGAIAPGDDIFVQIDSQWLGWVEDWYRVLSVDEAGAAPGVAVLKLARSDSFQYGRALTADDEPLLVTL